MRRTLGSVALIAGCAGEHATAPACERVEVYALYSDYQSARVGGVTSDARAIDVGGVDLGADVALASSNGRSYLLARDFDNLFELQPACGFPAQRSSLRSQASDVPLNPQSVARDDDGGLWIANYSSIPLLHLSADGKRTPVTVSDVDDDGNPQATFVHTTAHGQLVAWFARLDDRHYPAPKGPARIVYLDTQTGAEQKRVDTAGWNLFGMLDVHERDAYAAAPGSFQNAGETHAGIEHLRIDEGVSSLLVDEVFLGGSPTAVRIDDGCAAVIVVDATEASHSQLVSFSISDPAATRAVAVQSTKGYDLIGLAWANGQLYLGDRQDRKGKVRRFLRGANCTLEEQVPAVPTRGLPFALTTNANR